MTMKRYCVYWSVAMRRPPTRPKMRAWRFIDEVDGTGEIIAEKIRGGRCGRGHEEKTRLSLLTDGPKTKSAPLETKGGHPHPSARAHSRKPRVEHPRISGIFAAGQETRESESSVIPPPNLKDLSGNVHQHTTRNFVPRN